MATSGERRPGEVHQEGVSGGGNYHSAPREDGSGGRLITVGDNRNHTTNLYDKDGKYESSKSRGDGGPAKDFMKSNP